MNIELSEGIRPLWERIVMQAPALAALCFFGWTYQNNQHQMEMRRADAEEIRIQETADLEESRLMIIGTLAEVMDALRDQANTHTQAVLVLNETIKTDRAEDAAENAAIIRLLETLQQAAAKL